MFSPKCNLPRTLPNDTPEPQQPYRPGTCPETPSARGSQSRSRVAFSADGRTLVGAGLSPSIRRWHLATGKELPTCRPHLELVAV